MNHTDEQNQGSRRPPERALRIRTINLLVVILATIISLVVMRCIRRTTDAYEQLKSVTTNYITCEHLGGDMLDGSDYLTSQARSFAVTRDQEYLRNFFTEVNVTRRRENARDALESLQSEAGTSPYLLEAFSCSNELMERELYAMRLVVDAEGYALEDGMEALRDVTLTAADAVLPREEKLALAVSMLFDEEYQQYKAEVEKNVTLYLSALTEQLQTDQTDSANRVDRLLSQLRILNILLLVVILVTIALVVLLILWPLGAFVKHITAGESLPMNGAYELRYLAGAYNKMMEETQKSSDRLRHEAEHDPLTGLYNRGAFDRLCQSHHGRKMALMIVDVDKFKDFNDSYGHAVGDKILKKVGDLLGHNFRSTDFPCRIGGDEFAVIMTYITLEDKHVIERKIEDVRAGLRAGENGLPPVTVSIGVAFSSSEGDIFKNADKALYRVKEDGRDGCAFFEDLTIESGE